MAETPVMVVLVVFRKGGRVFGVPVLVIAIMVATVLMLENGGVLVVFARGREVVVVVVLAGTPIIDMLVVFAKGGTVMVTRAVVVTVVTVVLPKGGVAVVVVIAVALLGPAVIVALIGSPALVLFGKIPIAVVSAKLDTVLLASPTVALVVAADVTVAAVAIVVTVVAVVAVVTLAVVAIVNVVVVVLVLFPGGATTDEYARSLFGPPQNSLASPRHWLPVQARRGAAVAPISGYDVGLPQKHSRPASTPADVYPAAEQASTQASTVSASGSGPSPNGRETGRTRLLASASLSRLEKVRSVGYLRVLRDGNDRFTKEQKDIHPAAGDVIAVIRLNERRRPVCDGCVVPHVDIDKSHTAAPVAGDVRRRTGRGTESLGHGAVWAEDSVSAV